MFSFYIYFFVESFLGDYQTTNDPDSLRTSRRRLSSRVAACSLPPHSSLVSHFDSSTMVRLITQNLLSCPSKVCSYPANFPLSFRNVERIEMVEAEFNEAFIRGFLVRIEWAALRKSAGEVSRSFFCDCRGREAVGVRGGEQDEQFASSSRPARGTAPEGEQKE